MIMHGIRYVLQFDSEKFGHEYKILIKEEGYSGTAEIKSLGAAPLLRGDDSDSGISGTSLEMVIQADEDGELASLYTVDNKKFLVELYKNSSLIWAGYVLPEKYSEPYIPEPYDVSVTASDGLGILKDIPFTSNGEKTLFDVIRFCCNQTGITLDFIVLSSLVESSMNTGNSVLVQASLDVSIFQGKTCYEVLESILTSLDAFITEANGKWVIARYTDLDKEGFLYSNSGELQGKKPLESRELGNVHSELYPIGNLELEIEPANKSVKFTSDYEIRPSFLQNYDFSGGDSGWGGFEYIIAERKGLGFAAMHGNSGKQERYIQQSVSVEKSSQAVILEVKFALAQMFASMNGRAGEDREFALKIQLSGGGQVYYLTDEGWGTKDYRFPVHGSLQDMFWDKDLSTNYVDDYEGNFKITADGFPVSGQLTISIYNIYVEMSGTSKVRSSLFLDHVTVTNDCSGGVDVSVNLAEKASTSHEDIDICLTDVPFVENADKIFYNGLKVAGKYTSAWSCGGKTDSFLYTVLKSVCSRIGFPRKQLSGTIQGENLESLMLLVDKYSGSLFYPREFSLNLLTDELNVTLDQFMSYQELSGETIESARVTGGNTSEYRSSGENETRVYQSGAGVPMRIRDLSPVELEVDSVIEIDRTNVAKSGKATLQRLLEFILTTGEVWTEEKLKVVEGYILYLGEKIKSGDSDLWSGHSFDDYMDQAVKRDSDVQFHSFKSSNFKAGSLGAGVGMVNDDEFQTDKFLVRKIMFVLEMMVQRMRFQLGQSMLTPGGGFKITRVEVYDTYYRLFFDNDQGRIPNYFEVKDQGRIQNHNGGDQKYFWSLVIATGNDYIDLSREDKDGDGVPAVGDEVVQLGNRDNPDRQDALMLTAVNGEVGMITYFGIDSFDLSGKEGSWFGKHGGKKGAVIKGEVHITAGSTGLKELEEFKEVETGISDAQQTANDALALVGNVVEVTASSQVFKYGYGFTGTPVPATITLTAITSKIVPESYQWQFLHGTSWVNIDGATKKTLDVMPGDPVLFPSGTNVRSLRCVCNGDESFTDVFTLAKLADGATGKPGTSGSPGEDAYTVLLTNEAHSVSCDANGVPLAGELEKATTKVVLYKGASVVSFTLQNLVSAGGSFALDGDTGLKCTGLSESSATCTFEVKVDSVVIKKVFGVTKAKTGATGKPGTDGRGITSTTVTYQASTNGTTVPTGAWGTTIPSVSANQYLWTRTVITYTDGTTSTSYSIGKMGANGAPGAAGKGIKSTAVTYQASTSGTTVPTGTWGTTIPSVSANQYLWTRTIITYTDNTTSTSYSIGKMGATGAKGDKGDAGRGISSTAVTYQASTNGTTVPTGTWGTTIPSVSANQYLWTRTVITYTDGTTSTSYSIGKIGANGAPGAAGKGIKSTAVTYQASTSGTTVPTGTWGATIPSVSANQYLWTRTIITYTDNTTSTSYSIGKMGANGVKGDKGDKGDAGKGVKSVVPQYYLSTSSTTQTGGSWSNSIPAWTNGKFIWTRLVTTYTDNTTTTTSPVLDIANKAVDVAYSKVAAGIDSLASGITIFAKQTDFNALGTRVSTAESSIKTNASNIELKVSKNGVVAAINASPESVKISAAKIDLVGKVSFNMLDSSTQTKVNGKLDTTTFNSLKNSLGTLAYSSKVEQAQLGTTIIQGGHIKTDLLDVDSIFAKQAAIGGFTIGSNHIGTVSSINSPTSGMSLYDSFIKFKDNNVLTMIGTNVIPPSTGFGIVAGRLEIYKSWPATAPQNNIALKLMSSGHPNTYTDMGRNYALYADDGLIVSKDAVIDYKYYELKNSGPIRIDLGRVVMLNLSALTNVYLPTLAHIRQVLFLDSSQRSPFMIKISIFVWNGSARIYPSSGCTFYNRNGSVLTYFGLDVGEAMDVVLWSGGGNFVANVVGYAS